MKMKKILQSALLLSAGFIGSAQAVVTVGLNTDETTVNLGETVSLGIGFDFAEITTQGGTFKLSYNENILSNPVLNFQPASDLDEFGIQSEYNRAGELLPSGDYTDNLDITFSTLSFTQGITGAGLLGYLTFDTIGEGNSEIILMDTLGGFFDFNTFEQLSVDYQNGSVNVSSVSSVPVPAAVWMFASACGLLVGSRKKLNNR